MKLHCSKILLFFFPLNILVTSYHVYSKNKPSITSHHIATSTSRVLSECDLHTYIYDDDEDMKSVKENYDRQTSQRFEEYEERMKTTRQKCKEQCDKNVQEIILKDKREKSLEEKVETGCLKYGCGLGGVAASVGIFGGVAINIWKHLALEASIKTAIAEGTANILAAGVEAGEVTGKELVIAGLKKMGISTLDNKSLESYFATTSYKNITNIAQAVYEQHFEKCEFGYLKEGFIPVGDGSRDIYFCRSVWNQTPAVLTTKKGISTKEVIEKTVQTMVSDAEGPANAAAEIAKASKTATIKAAEEKTIEAASTQLYGAISYSILAILIIVLIMLIIYLILRYRRKKKMKKKAQYTKLLNE